MRSLSPIRAVGASLLVALAISPLWAEDAPKTSAAKPAEAAKPNTKARIAVLTLKGALPEGEGQPSLFAPVDLELGSLLKRIEKATREKEIAAILLRIRDPELGWGKINELRAAIATARKAGKKVYADFQSGTAGEFLVATACDQVIMPESGVLFLPGVRAEVTFYKGLFDLLGVEADMLQVGKFKGAAEPYSRSGMSAEFRQQYESVVSDLYEQLVATLAADRKLRTDQVRDLIDTGLFSAKDALRAKLVDVLAYGDEFESSLKRTLAVDALVLLEDYGEEKKDEDFSGMLGMVKLFEMLSGAEPEKRASKNKKVALIYAKGAITTGEGGVSFMEGESVGSDTLIDALREAQEDKSVVAIVLRVDSPGGSALASDLIWREVTRCEKPIVCSMGDIAASGGYYIAMGCKRIFAEPGTLTGSIGVVGGKIALEGLYKKAGLKTEVISRGRNSGLLSSEGKFSEAERKVWQANMEETYRQFVAKAAAGRNLKLEKLEGLAEGRIWTGRQAKENGLVDELGTLADAIAAAKKMAGIGPQEKVEELILPKRKSFFERLLSSQTSVQPVARQLETLLPRSAIPLRDAMFMKRLFAEPSVLVLPYRVRLR